MYYLLGPVFVNVPDRKTWVKIVQYGIQYKCLYVYTRRENKKKKEKNKKKPGTRSVSRECLKVNVYIYIYVDDSP